MARNDCEVIATCAFFNDRLQNTPALADLYKQQYCHADGDGCARLLVRRTLGAGAVPLNLYPTQRERAETIIASARS